MMKVAIRADASLWLGSGHVMRCLTLAEALRARGAEARFLTRDQPGHLGAEICAQGHDCSLLPPAVTVPVPRSEQVDWLGVSIEAELTDCAQALGTAGFDWLIVDHYGLDRRWESAMRPWTQRLMVIDDLADRPHDCDLLLDQNLVDEAETRYRELIPSGCHLLTGPTHALIRPSFHALASETEERTRLDRLLIFFGGTDPFDLTTMALDDLDGRALSADVVLGAGNPHRERIERMCQDSGGRWTLHVQTHRMAELMANADLALGAGGSTHWERCLMGLPALVVTVAANQIATTQRLHEHGACRWLGDAERLGRGALGSAIDDLQHAPMSLNAMSRAAQAVIPATEEGGSARVARMLAFQAKTR
ncbi:UDP-2,4-diacetamido-2,4,6-trideoxy-beta-L-altropyranose hydrolase [Thiocystis violacea]|uniref:UDP-2,4-diacetamido-2,4, 6-trideoxy-beta-L-altropyranose hydrolase n=1 Tax=Thiocystis violacea TaxID=13725 RepID=UPI001906FF81|nr:UDP-2,4-diacetamido-2,4,6-trideoxy-beta-L-altropyranose hydrolase [Thiocystis violacea]MBK1719494.1 UDP-2,4-diacetamido-2,4,6-trideoxy-beta-L-altropyranose hydrolase [Thiocystis violacea]